MEPWFNDFQHNDIPGIMINIRLPSKSCSKMYGQNPGIMIFGIMMECL